MGNQDLLCTCDMKWLEECIKGEEKNTVTCKDRKSGLEKELLPYLQACVFTTTSPVKETSTTATSPTPTSTEATSSTEVPVTVPPTTPVISPNETYSTSSSGTTTSTTSTTTSATSSSTSSSVSTSTTTPASTSTTTPASTTVSTSTTTPASTSTTTPASTTVSTSTTTTTTKEPSVSEKCEELKSASRPHSHANIEIVPGGLKWNYDKLKSHGRYDDLNFTVLYRVHSDDGIKYKTVDAKSGWYNLTGDEFLACLIVPGSSQYADIKHCVVQPRSRHFNTVLIIGSVVLVVLTGICFLLGYRFRNIPAAQDENALDTSNAEQPSSSSGTQSQSRNGSIESSYIVPRTGRKGCVRMSYPRRSSSNSYISVISEPSSPGLGSENGQISTSRRNTTP